jgi:deazaflavin-dependent oxidoreductase (nitroreductase family)
MTDDSMDTIREDQLTWIQNHKLRYLRSGGTEGHIEDITAFGGYAFATHCLLRCLGRKSGSVFITPLCYAVIGGEVGIVASNGGADSHPGWYLNLVESEHVDAQIARQAFRMTWREPEGAEREQIWARVVQNFPFYAGYQAATSRLIPVVLLTATQPIAVFSEPDADVEFSS